MSSSTVEQYTQLLSLAVHEFRTPLSVVSGYLRMLQGDMGPELNERQRKMIDEAGKSCARVVALITELSDIGKLDSGALTLARQPLDLFSLVADVAEHVHEASDRDVRLAVRGETRGAGIAGDASRLRHAFDAIFRAILREKVGPTTVIADRRREQIDGRSCAVIVIAEEGRVQDVYARSRAAFDDKRGGVGLALPLARRVFERHGGGLSAPGAPAGTDSPSHDTLHRSSAIITLPLTE